MRWDELRAHAAASGRGDWRVVQQAPPPYAKCAVSGFGDGPFVDFGVRISAIDPNILLQVDVLQDAARFIGMVPHHDHATVLAERDAALAEVERLKAELDSAREFQRAVDVIESADFRARRKRGPKPAERAAA